MSSYSGVRLFRSQSEIIFWREDKNTSILSVVCAKVLEIAGKKVCCSSTDRCEQYGPVFVVQLHGREERVICRCSGRNDLYRAEQLLQVFPLLGTTRVSAGFLGRVD